MFRIIFNVALVWGAAFAPAQENPANHVVVCSDAGAGAYMPFPMCVAWPMAG
jgi:hypothetical protein